MTTVDQCHWDNPGADPYLGSARSAIMALAEIPAPTRLSLLAKVESSKFDDVVTIRRDSINGKHTYSADLRNMAFGNRGRICSSVTRAGWSDQHIETAMVFCADGYCVARPAVCNNWAMVKRLADAAPVATATEAAGGSGSVGGSGVGPIGIGVEPSPIASVVASQSFHDAVNPPPQPDYWPVPPVYVWEPVFWMPANRPYVPEPPVAPPVDEPGTLWMYLVGLMTVLSLRRLRRL